MHDPIPIANPKGSATYIPPDDKVIKALAREVCTKLQPQGATSVVDADLVDGLAQFLKTIAHLTAKSLSNGNMSWLGSGNLSQYSRKGEQYVRK